MMGRSNQGTMKWVPSSNTWYNECQEHASEQVTNMEIWSESLDPFWTADIQVQRYRCRSLLFPSAVVNKH